MSYNLQVVDKQQNLNFNTKYRNLAKNKRPKITAKAHNGNEVKEKSVVKGEVLQKGELQRAWVDDEGVIYGKSDLTFSCEGEEVSENEQTKVFEVEGYQPESHYTDNYVISAYYELSPSNNGMKKDRDRQVASNANLCQMRKLWEHLRKNNIVARGEFCASSRGFVASDGYIRAIQINGNKWGLEVGVFKEEKIFEHLNEGTPREIIIPQESKTKKKRLKMV